VEGNGHVATATLALVAATFALDVFSTLNSSPQTTELFARDREDSLMHWVLIGSGVAVGGGAVGTVVSRQPWPLVSAAAVALGMWLLYKHAVVRGRDQEPPAGRD
jgi:hypothetical protein